MRLDGGGVDQHLGRRPAGRGQGVEDVDPDALGRPSDEAVVERLPRSVDPRRIDPAPARLQYMHDAADDPPVTDPRLAARVLRKQRLKPRKLNFAEPETIAIHRHSPCGDRESHASPKRNPLYGSGP